MNKIALIGEIIVDVTVNQGIDDKLRFGGIFHAARTLWALGIEYDILYFSPTYLEEKIYEYTNSINGRCIKIGEINNSPNIILIGDQKEIGWQNYDLLLRDEKKCEIDLNTLDETLNINKYSDICLFSGGFDINSVIARCIKSESKLHIDVSNEFSDFSIFNSVDRPIHTFLTSTSTDLFKKEFNCSFSQMKNRILGKFAKNLLLKENRGGSRLINENGEIISVGAQIKDTVHSVGVGDCFDLTYIAMNLRVSQKLAMHYSSWIASEYAATTFPEDFKRECTRILSMEPSTIENLPSIVLPWEKRNKINIYIAAPDFDYVDTTILRRLEKNLRYHNFNPILPVKENGQMGESPSKEERKSLYMADLELLNKCEILIAVMLYDDPGTLIEIGYAIGCNIPIIVYDPYNKANNLMLTESPELLASEEVKIIEKTYEICARIIK